MLSGRRRALAWIAVIAAPIPVGLALIATARPHYPPDVCYYGSPDYAIRATDRYLSLMVPLAMYGWAAAISVAAWLRRPTRWRPVAAFFVAWAALTLVFYEASYPVMYPGGTIALFGIFLTPPALAVAIVAGRDDPLRALAWFEALYLLPVLLGLAKILAQPRCLGAGGGGVL